MFTRRFYTLGYVLMGLGVIVGLSFLPLAYAGLLFGLPPDPWAGVGVVNIVTGGLTFCLGLALAGEL